MYEAWVKVVREGFGLFQVVRFNESQGTGDAANQRLAFQEQVRPTATRARKALEDRIALELGARGVASAQQPEQ